MDEAEKRRTLARVILKTWRVLNPAEVNWCRGYIVGWLSALAPEERTRRQVVRIVRENPWWGYGRRGR